LVCNLQLFSFGDWNFARLGYDLAGTQLNLMIGQNAIFQKPTEVNALIWRYLDFTKFVDLLETRTLFFTRADRFEDRFEGSYPRENVKSRPEVFLKRGLAEPHATQTAALMSYLSKQIRRYMAVNCWHVSPHESAAMWRLYLKSNEGIAIQSSYSRLIDCLQQSEETVHIGMVRYIDYDKDRIEETNIFSPFIYKRVSFAHENELRAMIHRSAPTRPNHTVQFSVDVISDGIRVPVDLEKLISRIFVAPGSPGWLVNLIKAVTTKYSISAPVVQSSLAEDPVY
jgi:hypothetical protein